MESFKIDEFIKQLSEDKFLIPTFQREFVWQPQNIIKLWDSIFRFYPVGSILFWETDSYLHTHRKIGGFLFPHDEDTVQKFKDWKYILDGQQRATSLFVSLLGGKGRVEDNPNFDYTLYFDSTDGAFFFACDLEKRKTRKDETLLIRLRDLPSLSSNPFDFTEKIRKSEGFNDLVKDNIQQLMKIFSDYKIIAVRIRGVEVNEVCEIFERINQEGKKLDPVDILTAKTYRVENPEKGLKGFYLREYIDSLKQKLIDSGNRYQDLQDYTIMQMVSLCLRKTFSGTRNPFGITPSALDNLTADILENNWKECQETILRTITFLTDMKIHGPDMLPYVYLSLPICYYFHGNTSPNNDVARQWFWYNVFKLKSFSNSSDVYDYCEKFFDPLQKSNTYTFERFRISRTLLVLSSYQYRNAETRAVLAFLANQTPLDFSDSNAVVLDNVYLLLSKAPNLHHIYPRNFLKKQELLPDGCDIDSLMNICFIRADTNIKISDKNPLAYFDDYRRKVKAFDRILTSHLIPEDYTINKEYSPNIYRDFLYDRADWLAKKYKEAIPDADIIIVD